MRNYKTTLMTIVALAACGGDSDVTSPPEGENFTLSVSGEGSGSGRVVSAAGATPAIDCSLVAGAQPTGVCSGTYAEGTSVDLTVTPEASSSFDGWTGDASVCSTGLSCTISMDANKTAIAQFSTASSAGVQITSSAWYPDPDFAEEGAIIWVVEVQNTTAQTVETARVEFASHDAAGNILVSDFTFVGPIPPGETRASDGLADYLGTEATVDIRLGEVQFATEDPNLGAAQIVSSNYRVDSEFAGEGAIIWTVEVQNTSTVQLELVQVDFITYDANGQILAYDFTFVGPIPPGGRAAAEGLADLHGSEASVNYQVAGVTLDEALLRR